MPLKKILAVAAAFAAAMSLLLLPAPAAFAWNEVCVKLPFGQAAYVGRFHVVHGFPDRPDGRLPGYYRDPEEGARQLPGGVADDFSRQAAGRITSKNISAGFHTCVPLRDLRLRTPFFVYVQTALFTNHALCATHSSNSKKYYQQQHRPFLKIWFKAVGEFDAPKCEYWKESN